MYKWMREFVSWEHAERRAAKAVETNVSMRVRSGGCETILQLSARMCVLLRSERRALRGLDALACGYLGWVQSSEQGKIVLFNRFLH
jgi:hypothetical protein